MSAGFYGWLGVAMVVFLSASAALRRSLDQPGMGWVLFGLALYTAGNLIMVRLMRESGMAVAISVSAVLQLVMANAVAIAVFGERPSMLQTSGIVLGVLSIGLIMAPGEGR